MKVCMKVLRERCFLYENNVNKKVNMFGGGLTMKIEMWTKFYGNPCSCWDISPKTTKVNHMVSIEEKSGVCLRQWDLSSGDCERLYFSNFMAMHPKFVEISQSGILPFLEPHLYLKTLGDIKLLLLASKYFSMKHNPDCNYPERQNLNPAKTCLNSFWLLLNLSRPPFDFCLCFVHC